MINQKKCIKCGRVMLVDGFYRNPQGPDGYRPQCKECEGGLCLDCGSLISGAAIRCRSCAAKKRWDGQRIKKKTVAEMLEHADVLGGEEWRDIEGFVGFYQVSNMGRVRRIAFGPGTRPGYILKPKPAGNGYRAVTLSINDVNYYRNVHQLVAQAFLEFPDNCTGRIEANHVDGDKTNNTLANLEYVTSSQNKLHSSRVHGTWHGERNASSKLTAQDVRRIRSMIKRGDYTQADIARIFSVSQSTISDICTGRGWSHLE